MTYHCKLCHTPALLPSVRAGMSSSRVVYVWYSYTTTTLGVGIIKCPLPHARESTQRFQHYDIYCSAQRFGASEGACLFPAGGVATA